MVIIYVKQSYFIPLILVLEKHSELKVPEKSLNFGFVMHCEPHRCSWRHQSTWRWPIRSCGVDGPSALVVSATCHSTLGDIAFMVSGPCARSRVVYLSSSLTACHLSPSRIPQDLFI